MTQKFGNLIGIQFIKPRPLNFDKIKKRSPCLQTNGFLEIETRPVECLLLLKPKIKKLGNGANLHFPEFENKHAKSKEL